MRLRTRSRPFWRALCALAAGANVVMVASALLRGGVDCLRSMLEDLATWLEDHEYQSVAQAHGSLSYGSVPDPGVYERANYMKTLTSYVPTW